MIKLHFTPKTYIFIAAYCHNVELLTPSTSFHPYRNYDFFCKPYANIRNWCPQCLGMLLSFLNYLSFQAVTFFQVVTKLINRNWFPVRFILKLLSALLVNRRKDTALLV